MTRRSFLRFLVAAPIVAPAVVTAIAAGAPPVAVAAPASPMFAGTLGVWEGMTWLREEFHYGRGRCVYAWIRKGRLVG